MANKLFINGYEIDLSDKTRIGITYQVNNLAELQNRQGNVSNVFKLPKTPRNRKILEDIDIVNSDTNLAYEKNIGTYFEDDTAIIDSGILTVISTDSNYNVRLNSGATDLITFIANKTVSDLWNRSGESIHPTLGVYNYGEVLEWNLATVFNSKENTENYIFPFIDWNINSSMYGSGTVNARYLLPCLFIKTIIGRMIEDAGLYLAGTFTEHDIYQKLILTPDKFGNSQELVDVINLSFFAFYGISAYVVLGNVPANAGTFTYNFPFSTSTAEIAIEVDGVTIYPAMSGSINLVYDLRPFIRKDSSPLITPSTRKSFLIEIVDITTNTVLESQFLFDEDTTDDLSGLAGNNDFYGVLTYLGGTLENHAYKGRLTFSVQEDNSTGYDYGFDDAGIFELYFDSNKVIKFGGLLFLNQLFTIKQKDLLKDVMNQFALIAQTDSRINKFYLNFMDDLIANIPLAENWSDKVDVNYLDINFKFGNFAKKNTLKYQPNLSVTAGFGDGFFTILDENLDEINDAVQLVTTATESKQEDDLILPHIKSFDNSNPPNFGTPNNRILILDKQDIVAGVTWNDFETGTEYSTTNIPTCYFNKEGAEINLTFDESVDGNLTDGFYNVIQQILNKCKGINLYLKIEPTEVADLNFLIPKFLDVQAKNVYLQGNFYLNKVENYKGGLTKCQLLRM